MESDREESSTALSRDPVLVIVPSISACSDGPSLFLDEKAISGLRLYAKLWPGSVRCIFRDGPRSSISFGRAYDPGSLPFEVRIAPAGSLISDPYISDAAVILASGDNHLDFSIAEQGERLGVPVCFVIEYILGTRMKILLLSDVKLLQKFKSAVWMMKAEFDRRTAFRKAKAIQTNGTPAADAYRKLVENAVTFFDTRLVRSQRATNEELEIKVRRILSGAPLRLIYTGRLERMKGADHLIEVARRLQTPFSLDIYGSGDLEPSLRREISRFSLAESVRIHEPIDFETALVPTLRSEADLFLCCHVQADPSCTYLETLGCGVPIVGFANKAWAGILRTADVGWQTPIGNPDSMSEKITKLSNNREELAGKVRSAASFAAGHCAEDEFRLRVNQLLSISKVSESSSAILGL